MVVSEARLQSVPQITAMEEVAVNFRERISSPRVLEHRNDALFPEPQIFEPRAPTRMEKANRVLASPTR